MRLIDADALLAEAMEEGAYGYVDAKQIADAPTIDAVQSERRWIPVTERLPEPYTQDILVTVDDGARYIDVLNYDTPGDGIYDVKWHKTDSDGYPIIFNDVVAWMDMKPWKGESDG